MSVPILSCPCGLRMKAKGATPGRVGRCPKCGRMLKVPDAPREPAGAEAVPGLDPEPAALGYGLKPAPRPKGPAPISAEFGHAAERPRARKGKATRRRPAPEDVPPPLPEVSREMEPWWRPDLLFPSRGAEGLMMVASLGGAFWMLVVVVPELCMQFVADASYFGAAMIGYLVALVAAMPAVILGPAVISYALQYYGRVLVSAARGEVPTPRPPDRNFDGLFRSLGPWLVWLACGATVGFGPLICFAASRGTEGPANAAVAFALVVVGMPYALMSLMMTFLHEQGMPRPFAVVGALVRFHFGFLGISAAVAGLSLVAWLGFLGVYSLREHQYFWTYFLASLPAWCLAQWVILVAMRAVGVFYHHHSSILRWHREKPWWGMEWS